MTCASTRGQDVDLSAEQAKIVSRTIAAVTDDLEAYPIQHGDQPVDGVRQLLHRAGCPAKRRWKHSPSCSHRWRLTWRKNCGSSWAMTDARLRALADVDPALLKDDEVEIPVQINGKLRGRVVVPAGADGAIDRGGRTSMMTKVAALLEGKTSRRSSWCRASWSISWWDTDGTNRDLSRRRPEMSSRSRYHRRDRPRHDQLRGGVRRHAGPGAAAADIRDFRGAAAGRPGRDRPAVDAAVVSLPARRARAAPRRGATALERGVRPDRRRVRPDPGGEGARPPGRQRQELALPSGRRSRGRHPPLGQPARGRRSRRSRPRPTYLRHIRDAWNDDVRAATTPRTASRIRRSC